MTLASSEVLDGGICVVTMTDPNRKNALSTAMLETLIEQIDSAGADPEVRAVVLTGAGGVFTSGGALDEMLQDHVDTHPWKTQRKLRRGFHRLFQQIRNLDLPVVAVIDGPAVGAGLDLALACDIRIATADATLISGFVRVGLVPGDGGAWMLPRLIGQDRALELMWTARPVDAHEALQLGLVTVVSSDAGSALTTAVDLARRVTRFDADVVATTKRLVRGAETSSFADSLEFSSAHLGIAISHHTHQAVLQGMGTR